MTAEAKRPLKVFLCHASDDKNQVRLLYKRLLAEGVDAWLDEEKLLPGQDWNDEILRALQESDAIIICLSKTSVSKEGYVQREIKEAINKAQEKPSGTIFVIPSRLDDCEIPNYLKQWQGVDLFNESGFTKLMRSLRVRADRVGVTIEPLGYESEENETERRLDQLYTEGLEAFYTENWDRAYQRFQMILRERPNHRDALAKLDEAELQRDLSILYKQATDAYQAGNWPAAIQSLNDLHKKKPDYKDASQLLKSADQQKQLNDLYTEARRLHSAAKWQAVVRIFDRIHAIDPDHPDTAALLSSSQKELAEIQRVAELNDLYTKGIREMDSGKWYEARSLLEKVRRAQTGYLETERLLRKAEAEIVKIEERNKRNDQINLFYEQAHGLVRSKNWRKAAEKIDEIQKMDSQFDDKDSLAEKINAALTLEEQEAQKQNQLAAMYADAVRLLKEEKYQEALDRWHEIRVIDPKYPDRQWVQRTAKRKLEEVSKPEVADQPWSTIVRGWISGEANIQTNREIVTESLLLLAFASIAIINTLWSIAANWLHLLDSDFGARFYALSIFGLYGMAVTVVFRNVIKNWDRQSSLILIVGWTLSPGIAWIIERYFGASSSFAFIMAKVFSALSLGLALKWAGHSLRRSTIIFVFWALAWLGGHLLGDHLGRVFNTRYTWAIADAFAILLGLLFTCGIQSEKSWEFLKTALFGALGFAVGNYVLDAVGPMFLPPTDFDPGYLLWGFIGGAILEAPSRNSRRILFSALRYGIGLLLGYIATLTIIPVLAGQSYSLQFPARYAILRNIFLGIGLGLAFGLPIPRASAILALTFLGAGMFMLTKADVLFSMDFFVTSSIPDAIRGALIGLVLGYGYGYMREAKPSPIVPSLVMTKSIWLGIIGLIATGVVIASVVLWERASEQIPSTPTPITAYIWNFDNEAESWDQEFLQITAPVSSDGLLTFKTTGGDPSIVSPGSLQIASSVTPIITVRMRIGTGGSFLGSIYFVTDKDNNWDERKNKIFSLRASGALETYHIDMSTTSTWQDVITQFRLDPQDLTVGGVQIEIDYISVHAP